MNVDIEPRATIENLTDSWYYEIYVRSLCADNFNGVWVGPRSTKKVVSTEELQGETLRVYPNPTKDILNVQSAMPIKQVALYNMEGKIVLVETMPTIDLSSLPAGVYTLVIHLVNGHTLIEKVIKS